MILLAGFSFIHPCSTQKKKNVITRWCWLCRVGGRTGPRVDPPAHGLDVQLGKASNQGLLLRTPVQESIFQGKAVLCTGRFFTVQTFDFFQKQRDSIRNQDLACLASSDFCFQFALQGLYGTPRIADFLCRSSALSQLRVFALTCREVFSL